MSIPFLYNNSITPLSHDEVLWKEIQILVFKERRNVIVWNSPAFLQIITKNADSEIVIVEIDLCIDRDRNDFLEQLLRTIRDRFSYEPTIEDHYKLLYNDQLKEIQKDDIFHSIFDQITQKHQIVLVFEKFDNYALLLDNKHYHRLSQLCKKKYFKKLNIILLINDQMLI